MCFSWGVVLRKPSLTNSCQTSGIRLRQFLGQNNIFEKRFLEFFAFLGLLLIATTLKGSASDNFWADGPKQNRKICSKVLRLFWAPKSCNFEGIRFRQFLGGRAPKQIRHFFNKVLRLFWAPPTKSCNFEGIRPEHC